MTAMRVALQMYDLPELRWATDALAAQLLINFRRAGFLDVPYGLDREGDYKAQWTEPDLLFAQTCGYPLVSFLKGQVRYVATPAYAAPHCVDTRYCSLLIVRADDPARALPDLRGRRAAINRTYSQSGYNALRHAVAPLAKGGRFFGEVIETGGHGASAAALLEGRADVAAVDCVTHALLTRHRPDSVAGLRVIGRTATAPNLPFITRGPASDEEVERLRLALAETFADRDLAEAREALLLAGVAVLPEASYDVILGMEAAAKAQGYAVVA
jgi:ABC-type phosphate/phosphonate transport system substrate-binding protein